MKLTRNQIIAISASCAVFAIAMYFFLNRKDEVLIPPLSISVEDAYGPDIDRENYISNCISGCVQNCKPEYGCDNRNCRNSCEDSYNEYNKRKNIYTRSILIDNSTSEPIDVYQL